MTDSSKQESDLFYKALTEADPMKRSAILKQAGTGDSTLRNRVEKMLAVHDEAEIFFANAQLATGWQIDAPQK